MDKADYFTKMKIQIYQRTLFIAVFVIVFAWGLSIHKSTLTGLDPFILPFFLLFCLGSLVLFKIYNIRYLRFFENAGFGLVFLYFLMQFSLEINLAINNPILDFRKFLLWIAILYTFAFLIFPSRQALLWSLFFVFCIFLIGVYYYIMKMNSPLIGNDIPLLAQIYGSGLIYISLLYAIAKLKEKYTESEIRSNILNTLANTDTLTGVFSRNKIEEILKHHIENFKTKRKSLSVMVLDLDKLKYINDTFGHNVGDYALQRTVELLQLNLRENDKLGRIGGDEFLLICPNTDLDQAKLLANRLEKTIADSIFDKFSSLTISIGIAMIEARDTPQSLINRADKEMYFYKKQKNMFRSNNP